MTRFQPLATPALDGLRKPPRRGDSKFCGARPRGGVCQRGAPPLLAMLKAKETPSAEGQEDARRLARSPEYQEAKAVGLGGAGYSASCGTRVHLSFCSGVYFIGARCVSGSEAF